MHLPPFGWVGLGALFTFGGRREAPMGEAPLWEKLLALLRRAGADGDADCTQAPCQAVVPDNCGRLAPVHVHLFLDPHLPPVAWAE